MVLKCLLYVSEKCPSYREYIYNKMTEKTAGTNTRCPSYGGVRLIEVPIKGHLTVPSLILRLCFYIAN